MFLMGCGVGVQAWRRRARPAWRRRCQGGRCSCADLLPAKRGAGCGRERCATERCAGGAPAWRSARAALTPPVRTQSPCAVGGRCAADTVAYIPQRTRAGERQAEKHRAGGSSTFKDDLPGLRVLSGLCTGHGGASAPRHQAGHQCMGADSPGAGCLSASVRICTGGIAQLEARHGRHCRTPELIKQLRPRSGTCTAPKSPGAPDAAELMR